MQMGKDTGRGVETMPIQLRKSQIWPTTHWSLVGSASRGGAEERRQALTLLVRKYLPVLRWHLISRRHVNPGQVDDLLQEFLVSKVLEKDIIRLADQKRGRFRTFLATALDRFVINRKKYENATKRSALRYEDLDQASSNLPDRGHTPSEMIDYFWARQVLGQAIRHMRVECSRPTRVDAWKVFRGRVLSPMLRSTEPVPFAKLAEQPSIGTTTRASHLLLTANRIFARSLRTVIGAYDSELDIEDEIRDLRQALSKPRRGFR